MERDPAMPAQPDSTSPTPPRGRPRLDRPRRIRVTTTVEPSKLALLREHARRARKSLGQLADEYVDERFAPADRRDA
jgi:hypothetical protein